jgi:hypothetical protein
VCEVLAPWLLLENRGVAHVIQLRVTSYRQAGAEQNRSKIHRQFPHRSKLRRPGGEPIKRVLLPPR